MSDYISTFWDQTFYTIDHMEPQHWALALASMIVVAVLLLRGMGSRANIDGGRKRGRRFAAGVMVSKPEPSAWKCHK